MHEYVSSILLTAALLAGPARTGWALPSGREIGVFPRPAHEERREGEFAVTSSTPMYAPDVDPVTLALSTDGRGFTSVGSLDVPPAAGMEEPRAREWNVTFTPRQARFVRFGARNIGTCPPWHPGAGGKAWLFVDELIVR